MKAALACAVLAPLPACAQYFQQQVDYTISASLDDERHLLHAHESFVYANRSPHALDTLWIHLWPNAYRDRSTALCEQMDRMGNLSLHFAPEEDRGWIDSLDFRVDGAPAAWGYHPRHADIGWVKLPAPLATGGSITVSTPFRVKVPDGRFSRLGHTGQAYYITQWYPKPAVYDAQGWHAMPYLTQGEFYSEFGSFDVRITLPANYVVAATGVLQDAAERERLDRMAAPGWRYPDPPADARTGAPRPNAFPPSDTETKTLHFVQDRVHDFAWFADKRFMVRKGSVALPHSGRTVTTWVMFTPKNALAWADAITYVNESVRFYSAHVGDYPYDACTAVDGTISAGGGMEYPMVTIIGQARGAALDEVIAHEVGHNWFYGVLASNERDHPWMDEGMNSFLELRYMQARYPGAEAGMVGGLPSFLRGKRHVGHRDAMELGYRFNARRNLDQPLSLASADHTTTNYGTGPYMKTALIMDHLMAYLGEEAMDRCLHAYFEEWGFRHPGPGDLRRVFERESGKDLGWVFDDLIASDRKWDLKGKLERSAAGWSVRALGASALPMPVSAYAGADSLGTAWTDPGPGASVALPWPQADRVRIDAGHRTLDIDRRNNLVRARGPFKRRLPLRLRPLYGLEEEDARTVRYAPIPAWSQHDGWQAGLALHNMGFPSRPTEWVIAPLYALGSERPVGAGRIEHHFDRLRSGAFRNIHLGFSARSASLLHAPDASAWYEKYAPYARFDLRREPLNRPWEHAILLRGARIITTAEASRNEGVLYHLREEADYLELAHVMADARKLRPAAITTSLTASRDWLRGSIDAQQAFAYNALGKQVRLRAFAGAFLRQGEVAPLEAWRLSWGPDDMLREHAYLDRGARDGFLGRQFSRQQGAFKAPFRQGGSDTWIASAGLEIDFPFKLPLAAFATAGWAPYTEVSIDGRRTRTASFAEAGLGVPIVRGVLEAWVPLWVSSRIEDEDSYLGRAFTDRIRFVLALEKLDPTRVLRSIRP